MSIPFSGVLGYSGGLTAAIAKQVKSVTLKPVKRVVFKFDPFHDSVEQTRYFMYHMNLEKVAKTNLQCTYRTQVVCDRSDPTVTFKLASGEDVVFKSANLSALEMLRLYNEHITVLAPKDEPAAVIATKSSKSASVKKLNKKR